jgi:two-component system NtrC family sensor kinase
MRSKFVVIFLGSLMILTGVLAWRAYELLKTEQKAALESQLRAQSTFASSGVESELQSVTRMMELADSEILRAGSSLPNTAVYQEFELIAKVSMPGAQGPDWKFEAKSFKEVSAIKDWAPTYLEVLFKKSSETDLRADSTLVFALPDPQKKPYLVVMQKIPQSSQSASSQVRVAILRSSWMQKLMDRSKGETATLRVINQLGQVVGHPTVEYVGSSLREDALVQNVMNSQVGTGSGIFETPEGLVLGQYEQVGASNLFVTLTVPTQVLYKNKKVILVQLLTIGVGISLLALAGFLWLVDNAKDLAATNVGVGAGAGAAGKAGATNVANGVAGAPTTAAGTVNAATTAIGAAGAANTASATATTAISLKEKMNIYTKVASGLSHELKAPVTAILGQTRVLRSELGSNHASIDKIEFEARHASELIQKLMAFSGEDKFKPTKSNVEALLQRALKSIEGKMLGKGVKLTKKIQSLPEIYLAPELFIKAVVSLLENAIEAMERAPKKELLVEASVVKGEIEITIQDSGEGISAVHLPKIFDPFFTTRTHQNHVGLGLATAQGIIKEMNGDIKIHSAEGQGVTAKIFLHPDEAISEVVVSTTPAAPTPIATPIAASAEVTPVATTCGASG